MVAPIKSNREVRSPTAVSAVSAIRDVFELMKQANHYVMRLEKHQLHTARGMLNQKKSLRIHRAYIVSRRDCDNMDLSKHVSQVDKG